MNEIVTSSFSLTRTPFDSERLWTPGSFAPISNEQVMRHLRALGRAGVAGTRTDAQVAEHLRIGRRHEVEGGVAQGAATGWKGRILTNPNCATVVLAMALAPLRQFGLTSTLVTTLQAISGAGYPGVPSWDILGNIIPHIGGGEEEKIETETRKILGALGTGRVTNHPVVVSATTTRVPVQNGHTGHRIAGGLTPATSAVRATSSASVVTSPPARM